MTDSIFNDAGATPPGNSGTPAGTPSNTDELGTLLAGIKNERGEQKYKTVNDALKALGHSQAFIPELQSKVKQTEDQMNQAAEKLRELDALKDTVAQLTERLTQKTPETPGAQVSEADIAEIISRQMAAKQLQEQQASNTSMVTVALGKQFGDKAAEVFYGKAQELGMSKEQINQLAASAPQAVLTMFGVSGGVAQKQTANPPIGTVNTAGFTGSNVKSLIGRETEIKPLGTTMQDTMKQLHNAKQMVDELSAAGLTIHDLTDPKVFFKHF